MNLEEITAALLETDALTGNSEGTPDLYTVHEDDVEHLVETVLTLCQPTVLMSPLTGRSYIVLAYERQEDGSILSEVKHEILGGVR